jgi:hypothetical protein
MNSTNFILLSFIPFIIADLYYAYNEETCGLTPIVNTSINFPIRTWLKVSGYTSLMLLLLPILSLLVPICGSIMWTIYGIYILLWSFFRLAWIVVGGVMFVGYLWPNHLCASGFSTYMWINLVVSIIQLISIGVIQRYIKTAMQEERVVRSI